MAGRRGMLAGRVMVGVRTASALHDVATPAAGARSSSSSSIVNSKEHDSAHTQSIEASVHSTEVADGSSIERGRRWRRQACTATVAVAVAAGMRAFRVGPRVERGGVGWGIEVETGVPRARPAQTQ